ncbi:hypothetical protein NDK43_10910 [Neobacillus pocheonensis]|uniref:Transcriptional regulator n=1 Tax=Neobacillus pocheonensis TaxID=363869 RepID=A0ABT0W9W6_9BACI|nr:hypothetical protein [Neobacillus pocheonensis]
MYRVGVVGPEWSVERILCLAKEFEQGMEFLAYPYEEPEETKKFVLDNEHTIHVWLFSGKLPYDIAEKILGSNENLLYIRHTESTLYKSLLNIIYSQEKLITRLSIDIPSSTNLFEESVEQLNMTFNEIYVKKFELDDINMEQLLQFHLDLWESRKTEGALTSFPAVYKQLKEAGVPVDWISTSRMEIRQTLRILTEKIKGFYFKDTQIGVEIIEIEHFESIIQKAKSPYYLQHLELRLKEILLNLSEQLNGSLIEKGNGKYVIFSSRGAIEREIPMLEQTIELLSLESDTRIAVGIGFGETVFSAEMNAQLSIRQSKEMPDRKILMVQENGKIIESFGKEEEITYSYRTDDQDFLQKLKKGNISVKTFHKIDALIRRMNWNDFTTKSLAAHLQMTERNARRIVTDLCEVDLAECIGEESSSFRGRPSKIYRLK